MMTRNKHIILYSLILYIPCAHAAIPSQNQQELKRIVQQDLPEVPAKKASEEVSATTQPRKKSKAFPIDRIEAVIFGPESNELVTLSDINRVSFDGRVRTKEDVIVDRLMFQDALKHRIPLGEKEIDDYIAKVAKSMNGTLDDVKLMFEQAGYTYEEGRRQLGIMYGSNQMIEIKIRMGLMIPERDVQAYYEEHPVIVPATYTLEKASFAESKYSKEQVEAYAKTKKGLEASWYQLPEIAETDLAENKKFITKLKIDEISKPQEIPGGYEIYRLKTKTEASLVPLEQRYREIVDILRKPKFDKLLNDYRKSLLDSASILYF